MLGFAGAWDCDWAPVLASGLLQLYHLYPHYQLEGWVKPGKPDARCSHLSIMTRFCILFRYILYLLNQLSVNMVLSDLATGSERAAPFVADRLVTGVPRVTGLVAKAVWPPSEIFTMAV